MAAFEFVVVFLLLVVARSSPPRFPFHSANPLSPRFVLFSRLSEEVKKGEMQKHVGGRRAGLENARDGGNNFLMDEWMDAWRESEQPAGRKSTVKVGLVQKWMRGQNANRQKKQLEEKEEKCTPKWEPRRRCGEWLVG